MGRGKSQKSKYLIEVCYAILEEEKPTSKRRVGYRLFSERQQHVGTGAYLPSMSMKKREEDPPGTLTVAELYRQIGDAMDDEIIPWDWVVDSAHASTNSIRYQADEFPIFAQVASKIWVPDPWEDQPLPMPLVWSEKATVYGFWNRS